MKKTKKAIASLAIASLALTTVPFNVLAADVPTRIAGTTAADTAVEISKQTGWSGSAILASSESYGMSDALAAGPLAYSLKAPILLTENSSTLNAATKAELSRLNVSTVYVTSGTAVIPQAVLNEITAMGITVVPLGGYDKSESSVNMAKRMTNVTKVAVANGVADALSVASIAAAANQPILVVEKDNVSDSVISYLNDNSAITSADVIGGTGIISDATANKFPDATRHFGYTAYDTNNQVIQDFAAALEFDIVYAANGETAIDALSGAPLAAMTKSPIVLTDGKTVPAAAAYVSSKLGADGVVTALGGTAVIPENNRVGIQEGRVADPSGPLAVTSIAANTARSFKIVFSKAVADTEEIAVEVLQSGSASAVTMSAEWNDSKTEVIVERSTKLPEGDYTVTVKEGETVLRTQDIAITEQKIAKIEIAKTLGIASNTSSSAVQKGYSSYKVLDQYEDDITKSALANNVNFQTGVGTIDGKNGLITITGDTNLNLLTFTSGITVSANDTSSGVATTQTLEVTTRIGTLSDLQIKGLTNENGKTEIRAGDTAEIYYLEYEAFDMGGEATTNYTLVKEGLILTGDNDDELTSSSPYVTAKVVQDPADSDKALIEVKATSEGITVDMPLVITAMTWAGTNSQFNSTLKKQAEVATIKLYSPDESIASGERKRIPFVAYDQDGDEVTDFSDLAGTGTEGAGGNVSLSNAGWFEDSDGTAYIKNNPMTVSGSTSVPLNITATLTNGASSYSMITINIQKPATADDLVLDTTKMVTTMQQGGSGSVITGYEYQDGAGNSITDAAYQTLADAVTTAEAVEAAAQAVAVAAETADDTTTGTGTATATSVAAAARATADTYTSAATAVAAAAEAVALAAETADDTTTGTGTGAATATSVATAARNAVATYTTAVTTATTARDVYNRTAVSGTSATAVAASQKIDLGWDEGGLRVRDNYDRYVDMTNTQSGEVNVGNKYAVRVSSSDTSIGFAIKTNLGADKTATAVSDADTSTTIVDISNNYNILAYKDQVTITSGKIGSATLRFELLQLRDSSGNLLRTPTVLDTKSQTITSLKDDDIKSYMVDQVTNPIYMTNEKSSATGHNIITNKEDEFKARPKVYGLTSSGAKVILRGTPIVSVTSSETADFKTYNKTGYNNGDINTGEAYLLPTGVTGLAWDQVRIVASQLTDENASSASATITVVLIDYNGDVKSVTTPITSSKTRPTASSVIAKVASEVDGVYVDDDDIYLVSASGSIADYKKLLGPTLAKYHTTSSVAAVAADSTFTNGAGTGSATATVGQEVRRIGRTVAMQNYTQAVHLAPVDQYNSKGSDLTRFTVSTNTGAGYTPIPSDVVSVGTDGTLNYGTGTMPSVTANDVVLKVTGTASSGVSKTVRIHFVQGTP